MSVPYVFEFSPGTPPQFPIAVEVPFSRVGENFDDWFELIESPNGLLIERPTRFDSGRTGNFYYKYGSGRAQVLLFRTPQLKHPFAQNLQVCFKVEDKSAAVHAAIRIQGGF